MNDDEKRKHNLCMVEGCENPATLMCICGEMRYCQKHYHLSPTNEYFKEWLKKQKENIKT
jgi:hypothetical protein